MKTSKIKISGGAISIGSSLLAITGMILAEHWSNIPKIILIFHHVGNQRNRHRTYSIQDRYQYFNRKSLKQTLNLNFWNHYKALVHPLDWQLLASVRESSVVDYQQAGFLTHDFSDYSKTMLVTTLYWRLYDGDSFKMLVAESSFLWFCRFTVFVNFNVKSRQPTSQISNESQTCHQKRSPTST